MSSGGRPKKENPALKNTKVSLKLNGWLNMLQEKAVNEGREKPSHSEIIEDAVLCRFPNIEEIKAEYDKEREREEQRRRNVFRKLAEGNGEEKE